MSSDAFASLLSADLGVPSEWLHGVDAPGDMAALRSRLPGDRLAWASATALCALLGGGPAPRLDGAALTAAFQSDRHLRIDGAPVPVWSPLSRFWPTRDGWVRTHGNYPHHAGALGDALGLTDGFTPEQVALALRASSADGAARRIRDAGGVCVVVADEDPEADVALRRTPLIAVQQLVPSPVRSHGAPRPDAPLNGIRVLDLSRVIAGPIATRALAFAGADVLRIDPPHLPEPFWQHLDTGHGKRSALLDIASARDRLEQLLAASDVAVLGYRPDGLRRLGLAPESLAQRHPHLVVAQLSAWPQRDSPRGFDSIVQAASGIARLESADTITPGALPAQILDHSAGHLLAAGVVAALRRRAADGGCWRVAVSLRRVAAALLGLPRDDETPASPPAPDAAVRTQTFRVGGRTVTTVAPALAWRGAPDGFRSPRPWGGDPAAW